MKLQCTINQVQNNSTNTKPTQYAIQITGVGTEAECEMAKRIMFDGDRLLRHEERKNLEHCLTHLKQNKINDEGMFAGWYIGNKGYFVRRHEKAMTMLRRWLSDENVSDPLAK